MSDKLVKLRFLIVLKVGAGFFILAVLLSFLSQWSWLGELFVSFRLQLFLVSLVPPVLFFILKARIWAGVLLAICFIQGFVLFEGRDERRTSSVIEGKEQLRILQYNVHYQNKEPGKLIEWLKANHNAYGIVFLVEVTPALRKKLLELAEEYPYSVNSLPDQWFTQAILSKLPILSQQVKYYGQSSHHYSLTRFSTEAGTLLDLYGVHLTAPVSRPYFLKRNVELEYVANDLISNPQKNKILIGDFNTTPYSQHFVDLLRDTNLAAPAYPLFENTWPTWFPQIGRITLDHCLVAQDMQILERTVGPNLGSDHLPVITEVALAEKRTF